MILVTNEGNVPLPINPVADVELRDDVAQVRDLRGRDRAAAAGRSCRAIWMISWRCCSRSCRPKVRWSTHLSVRTDGAPVELAPGQSARLELEITCRRKDCPPTAASAGEFPVLTEDLEFIVVTPAGPARHEAASARADTPKQPVDTRRRPAKASGRREK